MNCAHCEERLSDYLENLLSPSERAAVDAHLQNCSACAAMLADISEVLNWSAAFPTYEPPAWLATKIIANTPQVVRETWLDTLASIGRWFFEPRTAIGLLT